MQRNRIVEQGSWASLTHMVLVGFLLLGAIAMPVATGYSPSPHAFWNDLAVSAVVFVTSIWAAGSTTSAYYWLHSVLGAWLLVAPIVLRYPDTSVAMNTMAVGLIMACTGMFAALQRDVARGR